MAAYTFSRGFHAPALGARDAENASCLDCDGALSAGRAAGAATVAAGAMLLAAAPAVVAVVGIVSPGELDRIADWLLGASVAFSLVAAGRVPAAALFALALAGRRTRP